MYEDEAKDPWDEALETLLKAVEDFAPARINAAAVRDLLGAGTLAATQTAEDWITGLHAQGYPVDTSNA